ncbi:hypothetical protein CYMTET_53294 [Cymbomonas tetramitiformis]|uniref:Uncharacterized protein n=1 Tax=Cymbomonas tetramitiformis TaxID=36881 RepID=A0AAE0EPV9_9CHLO|nr:hypothetical protein CYMTET_53294 [Cymbomonas tetramitiformis]|eukprot:gene18624-22236_t
MSMSTRHAPTDENSRLAAKGDVSSRYNLRDTSAGGAARQSFGDTSNQGTRRALGDIGNLVPNLKRSDAKDAAPTEKEGAASRGNSAASQRSGEVSQLLNNLREKAKRTTVPPSWGATRSRTTTFKPREAAAPPPGSARNSNLDGHKSITSLLLSRSEAASGRKSYSSEPSVPDIDSADHNNPLACTAYVNDIYNYYRRVEPDTQVSASYMGNQKDINEKMRSILIDWLVEVHLKFKLMPETLFLTTNLIDRFLQKEQVTRKNLQLVGMTSMLLAAKYEEIWAPEVKDFVYISDKAYNRTQILDMEKLMLRRLKFNLTVPTAYHFLARFLKAAGADKQCELLAMYLTELSALDYSMLKFSASLLSAAAVYTALRVLCRPHYPPAFAAHSGFSEAQLKPCAVQLVSLHRRAPTSSLQAVQKKYSGSRFMEVAKLPPALGLLESAQESSS